MHFTYLFLHYHQNNSINLYNIASYRISSTAKIIQATSRNYISSKFWYMSHTTQNLPALIEHLNFYCTCFYYFTFHISNNRTFIIIFFCQTYLYSYTYTYLYYYTYKRSWQNLKPTIFLMKSVFLLTTRTSPLFSSMISIAAIVIFVYFCYLDFFLVKF